EKWTAGDTAVSTIEATHQTRFAKSHDSASGLTTSTVKLQMPWLRNYWMEWCMTTWLSEQRSCETVLQDQARHKCESTLTPPAPFERILHEPCLLWPRAFRR